MSPTIIRFKGYRFYFFSREEKRKHVHVSCPEGEAKFWLEPQIILCENHRIPARKLNEITKFIGEKKNEIISAWQEHFSG